MEQVSPLQHQALGLIRKRGGCTRREIGGFFGWGPASVSKLLKPMLDQGLLVEHSLFAPGAGRVQSFLKLNPDLACAIGVDIGFSSVSIALVNLGGLVIDRLDLLPINQSTPEEILAAVRGMIRSLRRKHPGQWILGTGVSFAGVVPGDGHATRKFPSTLPWKDVPIRTLLQQDGGGAVEVYNDTVAGLLAEARHGRALGSRDVIYLNMMEGISIGLLASDQIVLGHNRDSGEFGHICVLPDGPYCHCGGSGCLESVSSTWAILNQVKELMANGVNTGLEHVAGADLKLEMISQVAQDGGSFARNILAKAGKMIGGLLAVVANVMDPEKVILGGILSQGGVHPTLIENVKSSLLEGLYASRSAVPEIEPSAFGLDASLIGAAAMVFEHHLPAHPPQLPPPKPC